MARVSASLCPPQLKRAKDRKDRFSSPPLPPPLVGDANDSFDSWAVPAAPLGARSLAVAVPGGWTGRGQCVVVVKVLLFFFFPELFFSRPSSCSRELKSLTNLFNVNLLSFFLPCRINICSSRTSRHRISRDKHNSTTR